MDGDRPDRALHAQLGLQLAQLRLLLVLLYSLCWCFRCEHRHR